MLCRSRTRATYGQMPPRASGEPGKRLKMIHHDDTERVFWNAVCCVLWWGSGEDRKCAMENEQMVMSERNRAIPEVKVTRLGAMTPA